MGTHINSVREYSLWNTANVLILRLEPVVKPYCKMDGLENNSIIKIGTREMKIAWE